MDFKVSNNSGCNLVGYSMAWLESYYTFIDITIVLNIGILTLFSVEVMGLLKLEFSEIENTDDLPLPEELAAEAIDELEAAVAELNAILDLMGNGYAADE